MSAFCYADYTLNRRDGPILLYAIGINSKGTRIIAGFHYPSLQTPDSTLCFQKISHSLDLHIFLPKRRVRSNKKMEVQGVYFLCAARIFIAGGVYCGSSLFFATNRSSTRSNDYG